MSRIQHTFKRLAGEGRKALIPFITAGDPAPELTLPLMQALVTSQAFRDPAQRGTLVKSPVEFMVGTLRTFEIPVEDTRPLVGFETFAEDELIATDGDAGEIRAPCDDCTVLMPARAPIVGREAVYLTRPIRVSA